MTRALSAEDEALEGVEVHSRVVRIPVASLGSLVAIGLIVFVVLWRTWAVLQWSFQQDDWQFVSDAARMPFLSFITHQVSGHLQPGQFAIVWVVTRLAPLNYGVAVAPVLAATFVGGILMWRFLRALFGERPANLIPLAVFMLCPLSVPSALWWTESLQIITLQFFIVATLFVVLRYVRVPSAGRLATVALTYGGALLFWEKALLILPIVALFVLLFLGDGTRGRRLRSVSAGRWQLWAVLGTITAAYVVWYVAVVQSQLTHSPSLSAIARLAGKTMGSAVVPPYLGGPWSASAFGPGVLNELSLLPRLVAWGAALAIVGASLLLCRQAWRAWALPLSYIGLVVALVGYSNRLRFFGLVIGLDAHHVADSVPVFALALGLAFMVPLERRADPEWARRDFVVVLSPESETEARVSKQARPPASRGTLMKSWRFAIGAVLVYATSALITSYRMAGLADTQSSRPWFATVKSELATHPSAAVVDSYLPSRVIEAAFFPEGARASHAFAPIAPHVRWDAPNEHPLMFNATGHLRPVEISGSTSSKPGTVPGCGYQVDPLAVAPLQQALFPWTWGVRLEYSSASDAAGFVTVDGDRQPVRFLEGAHTLTLIHRGTATSVSIESSGGGVCVGNIVAGDVRPALG